MHANQITVKLRAIQFDTDFRRSELTNYVDWMRVRGIKNPFSPNPGEAILLVSKSADQLIWITNVFYKDKKISMVTSQRWRFPTGMRWSSEMLDYYAKQVGIRLEGRDYEAALRRHLR